MTRQMNNRSASNEAPTESASQDSQQVSQSSENGTEINPEDSYIKRNSSLQVCWNNSMEGAYYKRVAVLLITWHEKENDFKPKLLKEEIDALHDVFEKIYHFKVERYELRQSQNDMSQYGNQKQNPQFYLTKKLQDFLEKEDDHESLIIVYYAGHGSPGVSHSHLNISGRSNDHADPKRRISWSNAQGVLTGADGNVFVILDCCYASNINRGSLKSSSFETLAATSSEDTRQPGKESFTTALVWALQELAETEPQGCFSSVGLREKICAAPNFPNTQNPVLIVPPEQRTWIRIVLAPLKVPATLGRQPTPKGKQPQKRSVEILKLDFHFYQELNEDVLQLLAKGARRHMIDECGSLFKVSFDGAYRDPEFMLRRTISHWRRQSSTHSPRPALAQLQIPKSTSLDGQVFLTPTSASPNGASYGRHAPRRPSPKRAPSSRRADSPLDDTTRLRDKLRRNQPDPVDCESEEMPLIRVPDRRFRGPADEQEVSPEDVGHYFKLFCAAILVWIMACARPRRRRSVSQV